MKYIMFESPANGFVPVMFPAHIDHDKIARAIKHECPGWLVASAGHCSPATDGIRTYGESLTLKVGSEPVDGEIIDIAFRQKT